MEEELYQPKVGDQVFFREKFGPFVVVKAEGYGSFYLFAPGYNTHAYGSNTLWCSGLDLSPAPPDASGFRLFNDAQLLMRILSPGEPIK